MIFYNVELKQYFITVLEYFPTYIFKLFNQFIKFPRHHFKCIDELRYSYFIK